MSLFETTVNQRFELWKDEWPAYSEWKGNGRVQSMETGPKKTDSIMNKELAKYSASNSFQTRHETAVFAYSSSAIFLACAWSIFNHDWEWDYVDVMTFIIVTWFTSSLSCCTIWLACGFAGITDFNLAMGIHWRSIWVSNEIKWSKTESSLMRFTIFIDIDIV